MKFNLFKNWQIIVLAVFLILSIVSLIPSYQKGVLVKYVSSDSPFLGKVEPGGIITWANERNIESVNDWYQFENYTGVFRLIYNGQLKLGDVDNGYTGMGIVEKPSSKLNLGMDLVGGTRVLLEPKENVSSDVIEQIISTLQTRINIYGLRESKFQSVKDVGGNDYVQIEMAGGSREEIEDLLSKQGRFEGKVTKVVYLDGGSGNLGIGGVNHSIESVGDNIRVNNNIVEFNQTFVIDDVTFEYVNKTNETLIILANVFTGSDIKTVCIQDQADICVSRVMPQGEGYKFMFQVYVSEDSAERFAKVTEDMRILVDPNSGGSYLDGRIVLFLDDNLITDLAISSDLRGKALTDPLITGGRSTKDDAVKEKLYLQSILQSGELPVKLDIVKVDQISPTLGRDFMYSAALAGIIAAIAVGVVILVRYRKIKLVLPMLFVSFSEVVIILGAASLINWTIDLAAIAGIIAVVGTGIDAQIMIVDEIQSGKTEKIYTLKQRIKRAFFIIFGSASTTIAAMLPLMIIGIGVMRGFAITTVLGILIAIFVTRPAFSKIAERLLEKEELKG